VLRDTGWETEAAGPDELRRVLRGAAGDAYQPLAPWMYDVHLGGRPTSPIEEH
jgi:hypothetical protein